MLTSKQRAQLRGLAATEDTIVHIGKGGITENIITLSLIHISEPTRH